MFNSILCVPSTQLGNRRATTWLLFCLFLSLPVVMLTVATPVMVTAAALRDTITVPRQGGTEGEAPPRQTTAVVRPPPPRGLLGTRCTWASTSCSRQLGKGTLLKSNWPNTCLPDKRLAFCVNKTTVFTHHTVVIHIFCVCMCRCLIFSNSRNMWLNTNYTCQCADTNAIFCFPSKRLIIVCCGGHLIHSCGVRFSVVTLTADSPIPLIL